MTSDAIRALYQPAARYRVSERRYPAHTSFVGIMRAGTCYALRGSCRYAFSDAVFDLAAGDVVELPEGRYEFTVIGDDESEHVMVWELPAEFWNPGR